MSFVLLMTILFLNLISRTYSANTACLCESKHKYKVKSSGNLTINCTGIAEEEDAKVNFTLYQRDDQGNCKGRSSLSIYPNERKRFVNVNVFLIYHKDNKSADFTIYDIRENKSYCLSVKWSGNNIKPESCPIDVTVEDHFDPPMESTTQSSEKLEGQETSHDNQNQYLWFLTMLILVAVTIVAAAFFIYKRKLKNIQRQVHELQQSMLE
ncbi:uncharacterized protein LOC121398131 [Xenopus laevis]|uniref:Uncharacterized protein LOC121398131 n=2 Tax=Xenopus laevis TaxID=8355 RepID=A0A1L8EUT8_XENLA|nr:uncharacterized protein LOC121398131 [Xenopus laevis]XP_041432710.1 uncharacterized protein LOC121398131 [Xenopus laevis]OCT63039.1 hypothetical protein XELAEV_18044133mg [Xenopus laevis]